MAAPSNINPERWIEIEKIYYAALELDAEKRFAFLRNRSIDPEVRSEVESLLAANDVAGSFLDAQEFKGCIRELLEDKFDTRTPSSRVEGSTISHYTIVSRVGEGTSGEVYLARDTQLSRRVALKFLRPDLGPGWWVERFAREAKAASALNHPNILTIYEVGQAGDSRYIATEFVEGLTLREVLAREEIALPKALDITIQIAHALAAAHSAGIIHRDIKPENVMIRPDGLVKVLDFGLARMPADLDGQPTQTAIGTVVGTPRYMAPEQARGELVDARSDLFSLGAVLYEMIAGQPAFPGRTNAEVFTALLSREPELLRGQWPNVPNDVVKAIRICLEKDPARRYSSLVAFTSDLERTRAQVLSGKWMRPAWLSLGARPWRAIHLAVPALALVAAAAWQWKAMPQAVPAASPLITPITATPGHKDFVAFSPDGKEIAFAWVGEEGGAKRDQGGNHDIYTQAIGFGNAQQLTQTLEDELLPAWSPDKKTIAFLRRIGPKDAVHLISASGGPDRKLADSGVGVAWSPDGETLAIATAPSPDDPSGIALVSPEGGSPRRLTWPKPYSDSLPVFSPDGKKIAFLRSTGFAARDIFVIPASGGLARQITFDKRPIFGVTWTKDGSELVFAVNRGTGDSLWRIAESGGSAKRIVLGQSAAYPAISRTGNRLAYTEAYSDSNIYRYSGPSFSSAIPRGVILSSREDHSPQISPDGKRIVFLSKRTGTEEIWTTNSDGSNATRLTSIGGPGTGTPHWSPDGAHIAFDSRGAGNGDIYVIPSTGGPLRRLTPDSSNEMLPVWSRDGGWLYFTSNRGGDGHQIWRMPSKGGPAIRVTRTGALEGAESPDGKLFYFTKDRGVYGIWSTPVTGGEEKPVPGLARAGYWRSWGVGIRGIYYVEKEARSRQRLMFFNFATKRTRPLTTLEKDPPWLQGGLAIAPDETWLLLTQLDQAVDDIMLVEDFR